MVSDLFAKLDELTEEGDEQAQERKGSRSIEEMAPGNLQEQARIAQHYMDRVQQALDAKTMTVSAAEYTVQNLEKKASDARARIGRADDWFADRAKYYIMRLGEWVRNTPVLQGAKKKSIEMGTGVLGSRTNTTKARIVIARPEAAAQLFPEQCALVPKVKEIVALLEAREDGTVVNRATGEVMPADVFMAVPGSSKEIVYAKFGKQEVKLNPWEDTDGTGTDGADSTGASPDADGAGDDELGDDPFGG